MPAIGEMDALLGLQIQYHRGVREENILCAEEGGVLAAAGCLLLHETRDTGRLKVTFSRCARQAGTEAEGRLLDGLLDRFREIGKGRPGAETFLCAYCGAEETGEMQRLMERLMERGFALSAAIPVMGFDLTGEIRRCEPPEGLSIERLEFDRAGMDAYLKADASANAEPDSEADCWFRTGDPSFACFAAKSGGQVVGAVSIWEIGEGRGATENIFVVPQYRRKNVARALISTAFETLKDRGMKLATLSLRGENLPAMRLYLSCGYTLRGCLIELRYEPKEV